MLLNSNGQLVTVLSSIHTYVYEVSPTSLQSFDMRIGTKQLNSFNVATPLQAQTLLYICPLPHHGLNFVWGGGGLPLRLEVCYFLEYMLHTCTLLAARQVDWFITQCLDFLCLQIEQTKEAVLNHQQQRKDQFLCQSSLDTYMHTCREQF